MFRPRRLAILLVATCACAQITVPGDGALRAIHEALFDSFIPVDQAEIGLELKGRFISVRNAIWASASNSAQFRRLLIPLLDLRSFGGSCGMTGVLSRTGSVSFAELSPAERQHVLLLLSTCGLNQHRMLAMTLRDFYIARTYEPLQEGIAGVHLNLVAPRSWIDAHRPWLPATRLRFDPASHEVFAVGGPIDYLIVGSGPAGSVLAHELRRGGKRVLLVERGSLIVPGSLQTRMIGDLLDSRTSADGGIVIHNGMAVGGGTQVNVDLCFAPTLPSIQNHIEMWRSAGRIGLLTSRMTSWMPPIAGFGRQSGRGPSPNPRSMVTTESYGTVHCAKVFIPSCTISTRTPRASRPIRLSTNARPRASCCSMLFMMQTILFSCCPTLMFAGYFSMLERRQRRQSASKFARALRSTHRAQCPIRTIWAFPRIRQYSFTREQ
jgi:hypothetical protein